jgi:multicomponent Na+:H+ antiporter subunit C
MDQLQELIQARFNYWIYVILMMIGLYAMITKKNLIKKLIGMSIFQTAIILFFVSMGVKRGATLPIISNHGGHEEVHAGSPAVAGDDAHPAGDHGTHPEKHHAKPNPDDFANPLPHVLMLTAIVVGVATLGVGLAVTQIVYVRFRSIEEDTILKGIQSNDG